MSGLHSAIRSCHDANRSFVSKLAPPSSLERSPSLTGHIDPCVTDYLGLRHVARARVVWRGCERLWPHTATGPRGPSCPARLHHVRSLFYCPILSSCESFARIVLTRNYTSRYRGTLL